jgi:hypothetical protein
LVRRQFYRQGPQRSIVFAAGIPQIYGAARLRAEIAIGHGQADADEIPMPPPRHQPSQAEADRVERRWPQVAGEALSQDGLPRGEIEQTHDQVKVVQAQPSFGGEQIIRRQPDIVGTAVPKT